MSHIPLNRDRDDELMDLCLRFHWYMLMKDLYASKGEETVRFVLPLLAYYIYRWGRISHATTEMGTVQRLGGDR